MQPHLSIERFDSDTRWDLRAWLNTPWHPPFDQSEADDLFTIFTLIPFIGAVVAFFLSCAVMLNQGFFDQEHGFVAGIGFAFASVWVLVKLFLFSKTHYEPLHYITEAKIKDHIMELLHNNSQYLGVAQQIKDRLNSCDERWAQDLLRRLQHAVAERRTIVKAVVGAQVFEKTV